MLLMLTGMVIFLFGMGFGVLLILFVAANRMEEDE